MLKKTGQILAVTFLEAAMLPALAGQLENCTATSKARLTIRVWDRSHIDSRTLARAQVVTNSAFNAVGLDIHWIHCGEEQTPENLPCQSPLGGPYDLSLRIIRLSKASRKDWRSVACGSATGSSVVYIFYDRLETLLNRSPRVTSPDLALGVTMAHEIGHLLLPPGHALKGIMRARLEPEDWKLAEVGCLTFCSQEAEQIMRRVGTCNQ